MTAPLIATHHPSAANRASKNQFKNSVRGRHHEGLIPQSIRKYLEHLKQSGWMITTVRVWVEQLVQLPNYCNRRLNKGSRISKLNEIIAVTVSIKDCHLVSQPQKLTNHSLLQKWDSLRSTAIKSDTFAKTGTATLKTQISGIIASVKKTQVVKEKSFRVVGSIH